MKLGWLSIQRHLWGMEPFFYWFKNRPGVRPGRWGFHLWVFEFGSRNPGHWFGVFLHHIGLWK